MLYCNDSIEIFHIHIPRTSGRYIRNLFVENGFDCFYYDYRELYRGKEIPHLHYPWYNNLEGVEECDNHFTVVRDPYEKFISIMNLIIFEREYPDEIYEVIKDENWLFNFIDDERDRDLYLSNSFEPQSNFISDKTKIYKMENGINENFVEWINSNYHSYLKNLDVDYALDNEERRFINTNKKYSDNFDPAVKQHIKKYYEEDYVKFNYS